MPQTFIVSQLQRITDNRVRSHVHITNLIERHDTTRTIRNQFPRWSRACCRSHHQHLLLSDQRNKPRETRHTHLDVLEGSRFTRASSLFRLRLHLPHFLHHSEGSRSFPHTCAKTHTHVQILVTTEQIALLTIQTLSDLLRTVSLLKFRCCIPCCSGLPLEMETTCKILGGVL